MPHTEATSLTGELLVAMPTMGDPRFERAVIYVCAHNDEGAMGLIVNKLVDALSFGELLDQVGIETEGARADVNIHFGGPVETSRGFVLHSTDYVQEGSMRVSESTALTATLDVLRDIAHYQGPRRHLLALGYAGWGPGQLDQEIQANGWLHVAADEELLFASASEDKWERAIAKLGFDPSSLSGHAGHA